MDLRLALYELAAEHRLDARASRRLEGLAGFDHQPEALSRWLPIGIAVLAVGGLVLLAVRWASVPRVLELAPATASTSVNTNLRRHP